MSFRERVVKILKRNVVLITTFAIVISSHWGWSELQHTPGLVPVEKRTELPIVIGAKALGQKIINKFQSLRGPKPTLEDTDKTS